METSIPSWRRLGLPVVFGLLCVVLTLGALRMVGGALPLGAKGYELTVPLPSATNLVVGSDVQQAGVRIGRVRSVVRTGSRARALIEIDDEFAPLGSEAAATVRTKTMLGEGYLEIAPGPASAPRLRDGGRMPAGNVRPAVQLDEFLETFTPPTRARFRSFLHGFGVAFDRRSRDFSDALGSFAPLATSVDEVLDELDGQQRDLEQVLARSGVVFDAIGRREGAVRRAVGSADEVLRETARRNAELTATVRALPPFLRELRRTADVVRASSGDLQAGVGALERAAPAVAPALRSIGRDVPAFTSLFDELPPVLRAGRAGFPALTRVLDAAGPSLRDVLGATRELQPIMELLAAYRRPSLLGPLSNVGSFSNGTMVGPGGRILHRGGGAITVWNETIGGWIKRLPTNRANPYLKPDGLDAMGREPLQSYDCRNVGNVPYVPATGTGAPPCVTQGPWTYNGRSAFYPRLLPAPVR